MQMHMNVNAEEIKLNNIFFFIGESVRRLQIYFYLNFLRKEKSAKWKKASYE